MEWSFTSNGARTKGGAPWGIGAAGIAAAGGGREDRSWHGPSAEGWPRHAGLDPALGYGKNVSRFAGVEDLSEAEHPAIAAFALRTLDREGGAKASAVGRVCRGRDDVVAH